MGLLALQRLMSVKRERRRRRRRRRNLARNRFTIALSEREDWPFLQRVGDGDFQHGETSNCSTTYLPEDIWRHIHFLMPMRDAARAACLSHAFLRSWRCHPKLTLDLTLCSLAHEDNFSHIIDSILRNHSGIGLKVVKLNLGDEDSTFPYVNSWLQVAFAPGIQELSLSLYRKYNFPCSLLSAGVRNSIRHLKLCDCVFRPTAELGPLRSLTSLTLGDVRIKGDELECLLSNSLALEQLDLRDCREIIFLKIPCVLQQLSFLHVEGWCKLRVIECKAPNLSSFYFIGDEVKLSLGEPLRMRKLHMHCSNVVCYARAELPSYMSYLETLEISSGTEVVNTPMLPTKFLYLKHLTIIIRDGTLSPSYDYFSLVSFLDASPSLETFFLDVSQMDMKHESVFGGSSHLRQLPEHQHNCLKSAEIIGFNSAKSLVELACCIVKNAILLERLTLDTLRGWGRCSGELFYETCWPISNDVLEEASRAVMAIRMYIDDKVGPTTKLTVLEPCTRCYPSG
ncbi:hypothetical protein ACP4OV_029867 [Aristida adscensionis]